jgi:DNA-binding NarL/FixJ family response regulator
MKVVLIEDSIPLRERFRALINAIEGTQMVGEADNEDEALELIARLQPDVVLLDLLLSVGSGLAVLKQVKATWPAIKVAVITSHAEPHYRERCMGLGADRFYDKQKDMPACLGQLSDWATPSSSDDAPRPVSPGELEPASARLVNGTPLPSDE